METEDLSSRSKLVPRSEDAYYCRLDSRKKDSHKVQ